MPTTKAALNMLPPASDLRTYVGTGYPPRMLSGLKLINSPGDLVNDIMIAGGSCRDIDNSEDINLLTPLTKRIDAPWSKGNNNGWLDTGVVQAGQTYHAFTIKNPSTGEVDSICSTSPVSPNLSAGWTAKRRVGAIMTNETAAIRPFLQTGRWFYHLDEITDASNAAIGANAPFPLTVPAGIKVIADFTAVPQASVGSAMSYFCVCDPDLGAATLASVVGRFTDVNGTCQVECITDSIGRVNIYSSVAGLVSLFTRGWYDSGDSL